MKTIVLILFFLVLSIIGLAQLNYGVNIGTGFNKELIYNNKTQITNSYYKISYKTGIWCNYIFLNKFGINSEINYFRKNANINQINLSYNYIENPNYISFKAKKISFLLGISNNWTIDELIAFKELYTNSLIGGISFNITKQININFWYNRELISHNLPIEPNNKNTPKYFHQNYLISIYFKLKK